MWAVLDANSYFCSVEKVFHPGLRGKPVVVLSSNDGIIVALTPEAKALGLNRGDPIFKVRGIVERNAVHVFSTNMVLYAAMSKRVQNIIRQSFDYCESYSIDEMFADLSGFIPEPVFNYITFQRATPASVSSPSGPGPTSSSVSTLSRSSGLPQAPGSSSDHILSHRTILSPDSSLDLCPAADIEEYMRGLVHKIGLWTDIPVSVGVASSKTLAKLGSRFAKNYPGYRSVCVIDTEAKRRKALELSDLSDVWGVGRRTYARLLSLGIRTPLEFADKPGEWVHRHFSKPGIQTWKELNGYPCVDTSEILRHQSITTSRSFGNMISSIDQVKASVASFSASCAGKLRGQGSTAGSVSVFLCSNSFREDLPQYFNMASYSFPVATADTLEITCAAMAIVDKIFLPGVQYKKSGVILGDIENGGVQQDLFDPVQKRDERLGLSRTIDMLNHKFGLKTVKLAVEGTGGEDWRTKSMYRSPDYLTMLDDILTINV